VNPNIVIFRAPYPALRFSVFSDFLFNTFLQGLPLVALQNKVSLANQQIRLPLQSGALVIVANNMIWKMSS
jgi:hypothetical protein